MRLISLATELGAEFSEVSNTFNAEILIKPNSKIALSSIVAELNIEDNNTFSSLLAMLPES